MWTPGILGASLVIAGALAWVPSAQADVLTPSCTPSNPQVGDGPLPTDAPDGVPVPVVLGCYNGELDDGEDADSYLLAPRAAQVRIIIVEGCAQIDLQLLVTGGHATWTRCAGGSIRVGILAAGLPLGQPASLAFSLGPGVYFVAFE